MENKLRQALEQDEFEVWYQPRYAIPNHEIVGAEALLRWHSPELKSVPPSKFIPLAEDIGLIVPLGEWVLRKACEENCLWQTMSCSPLHVSVNLSARQFIQEDLLSTIENVIEDTHMNPERLELELTESLIMPNAEDTIETLRGLKKLGIQISMDDFGTGYSSLSYLKRFPIDTVKIDQSFIRDIHTDADDKALVTAIIAMAHSLKLEVVAEGVETYEQFNFLNQYQCDYVQGYLFGRPMPAIQFRELINR
jgi:EAL domain-containing protein (putative c-di-GMP-specific phosphodiesterase class I)